MNGTEQGERSVLSPAPGGEPGLTPKRSPLTLAAAAVFLAAGFALGLYRGGALPWLAALLGLLWLAKSLFKPSPGDLRGLAVAALVWLLCWPLAFFYAISIWERGEVVELSIESDATTLAARTWIMEDAESPVVFYDAPEATTQAWMEAERIQVERGAVIETFIPRTVPASQLPEEDVERVTRLVDEKYGELHHGTLIMFGALGHSPGRTMLVIWLEPVRD